MSKHQSTAHTHAHTYSQKFIAPKISSFSGDNVEIGISNAWPLTMSTNSLGVEYVNLDPQVLKVGELDAYQVSPNMTRYLAKFLAYLYLVPRHELAASREKIVSAFAGSPAPGNTATRFMEKNAKILNDIGSIEMAKLHVTALRRLHRQTICTPNRGPQIVPRYNLPSCPFGSGCIYMFYSAVMSKIFTLTRDSEQETYRLWQDKNATRSVPMMPRVKINVDTCYCPYDHPNDHRDMISSLVDQVFEEMREFFVDIAWRLMNKVSVYVSDSAVHRVEIYSRAPIRDAIMNDNPMYPHTVMALIMRASLDNSMDIQLIPSHPEGRVPGVYTRLATQLQTELANWEAEGSNSTDTLPYLSFFKLNVLLKIPTPIPVKKTVSAWSSEITKRLCGIDTEAPATSSVSSPAMDPAVISVSTPAPAPTPAESPAMGPASVPVVEEAPVRSATLPAYRKPLHGNRFVPRFVTDEYLDKNGFDWPHWAGLPFHEKYSYVRDRMIHLYVNHSNPDLRRSMTSLAEEVTSYHHGDPYVLFDAGIAYIALSRDISRNLLDIA